MVLDFRATPNTPSIGNLFRASRLQAMAEVCVYTSLFLRVLFYSA